MAHTKVLKMSLFAVQLKYVFHTSVADSRRLYITNRFVQIKVASALGTFLPASPSAFNNHSSFEFDGFEHIITYFMNIRCVNF